MKQFTSKNQKIGLIGEKEAEMFLVKQGFSIIDRNFSSKTGEIDIVAQNNSRIHFIEVKTVTDLLGNTSKQKTDNLLKVSRETSVKKPPINVSRETFLQEYRKIKNPFQNISSLKIKKLLRTVHYYLKVHHIPHETVWQCDGIGVYLNQDMTTKRIEYLEHIEIK